MNDFVLRGFCQKCKWPISYSRLEGIENSAYHDVGSIPGDKEYGGFKHDVEPVWFLSPKQMKIVWNSIEFRHWYIDEDNHEIFEEGEGLAEYVEKYPFLVAKILSDAGKDSV